jgi:dihydroneopterin aldolase
MIPPIARFDRGLRHVFVRDMVLAASIGVYPHEQTARQRVRINVDLGVDDETVLAGQAVGSDTLSRVVDYEKIASRVRDIVHAGHVRLVETLAERIAEACLVDRRVRSARIRVEKLDIFPDAVSAGVEIERAAEIHPPRAMMAEARPTKPDGVSIA